MFSATFMTQALSFRPMPLSQTRLRARRGFSILELAVVLVLVGIVTGISTGRITAMRAQQQVTRSASLIQTQLEKAFAIAGRNRAPMRIVWNSTSLTLSVTDRAGSITYGYAALKNDFGMKSGEVTVSQTPTEVYPNGFANSDLTITIQTSRGGTTYKKIIYMTRSGLVKIT
jgi:prepilin-type N-terminal cleavage/methylation domain-containing protein